MAALRGGAPAIAPGWTLDLMARHSLDFWLTSEDLPDPENRVTLDREGHIVLSYTPNNLEGHERLVAKLRQIMKHQKCGIHGSECHQGLFSGNFFVEIASLSPAWPIKTERYVSDATRRLRHWT